MSDKQLKKKRRHYNYLSDTILWCAKHPCLNERAKELHRLLRLPQQTMTSKSYENAVNKLHELFIFVYEYNHPAMYEYMAMLSSLKILYEAKN